jgi:hypothetical protein
VKDSWTTRWFRKRALLYHLLVMILAPGCLLAGWWQINRAESGNTLSYLYAVEWPIFALLSVVGWWQLIHENPADVDARKIERARRAAHRGPFVPPPADADSGFYHPLGPGPYGALESGAARGAELVRTFADGTEDDDQPAVHALSSYNTYLARLSAGGGRKSWRNPHGLARGARRIEPAPALGSRPDTGPLDDGSRPTPVLGSHPTPDDPSRPIPADGSRPTPALGSRPDAAPHDDRESG